MLGVFAGQLLRSASTQRSKVLWLVGLGVFCLLAGMFWGGWIARWFPGVALFGEDWSQWPIWCPIIKNRWTSAYALYAGGWSYLLLALFYLVIDVWGLRRWAFPFIVIGANSLAAYMAWQLGLLSPGRSAFGRTGTIRRPLVGHYPGGRGIRRLVAALVVHVSKQDLHPGVDCRG
jgi:predicted acyltransferase